MWLMTATNPRVNPSSPAAQKRSTFGEESWWFCASTESDVAVPRCCRCRSVCVCARACALAVGVDKNNPEPWRDILKRVEGKVWCFCALCDSESAIAAFFFFPSPSFFIPCISIAIRKSRRRCARYRSCSRLPFESRPLWRNDLTYWY